MMIQTLMRGFVAVGLAFSLQVVANDTWLSYPADLFKPDLQGDNLVEQWPKISRATQDLLPENEDLRDAWRTHFEGNFAEAKKKGLALGTPDGKYVAYRAQTIYAMYMAPDPEKGNEENAERTVLLKEAADELYKTVKDMEQKGITPTRQIVFWGSYAMARYVEIMKPTWDILTKKSKVNEMLSHVDEIPEPGGMPALLGLFGGAYAAIYHDGYVARLTFRSYVKNCRGDVMKGEYAKATPMLFECAIEALGNTPFPEIYNSYAKALLQIDPTNTSQAELYRQYATGASVPPGVKNMIFSAEDALARNAAKKQ